MELEKYVEYLSEKLDFSSDSERAVSMAKYMRNKFSFYGVPAPIRKKVVAEYIAGNGYPEFSQWLELAKTAWSEPREVQYAMLDIWIKRKKQIPKDAEEFLEFIITENSWWDTVDSIASSLVGQWVMAYPEKKEYIENNWLTSNNLWLQRTAIIYQLKHKEKTDLKILENAIRYSADHPDFFIRKAIGWVLREYSKVNQKWVEDILNKHQLSNLSVREAMKWVNRQ
jgi:3-methyladenine DNA glycosylase AlkD